MEPMEVSDLHQVELLARDAPAAMLRYLIRVVEREMARDAEGCGEHGRILLLKLHHLLTQQQVQAVHAAHQAREATYLAPELVLQAPTRRRPRRARAVVR